MQSSNSESIHAPIITILLFEVCALFARNFLQLELLEDGQPVARARNLSYLIVPPILFGMMFPILKQYRGFLAARFTFPRSLSRALGIGVLVGLLLRLAYWGQLIGFTALGIYRNNDPNAITGPLFSFSCPPVETVLLYVIVKSFLVPVIEEVLNRGFFLYSFLNRGRLFAILLSSLLFAAFHSPASIPHAFVIGLFLAVLALNTNSLWTPIAAHAVYNGTIVLDWMCLGGDWNPPETTPALFVLGIAALLVTIVALLACGRLVGRECAGTNPLPQRSR